MKTSLPLTLGHLAQAAWEFSHFVRGCTTRVIGSCDHALALTSGRRRDQSRVPSLDRLSPASTVLRTPRTPAQHGPLSPSAYRNRLRPTWAAGNGSLLFRTELCPHALPHTPRASCTPPDILADAVSCLRRDMSGSATRPFGCFCHEAVGFASAGPANLLPSVKPCGSMRAFDAPLSRQGLPSRPGPATRRTGASRDGTSAR